MDPAKFKEYKIFEPNLTISKSDHPCSELLTPSNDHKYTDYFDTVTHGDPFGVVKVTLDLYAPTNMPDHSCCAVPLIHSLNCLGIPGKPTSLTIFGTGSYCCPKGATEEAPCGTVEDEEPRVALEGGVIKLVWSDCGDKKTHGHITSLEPATLTIGSKTSITGKGSVDETIQGATYEVTAKAFGIPIFSHKGDACKPDTINLPAGSGTISLKGFACPMSKGNVELDLDVTLASTIPAKLARTTIVLKATGGTGDKTLCVQIKTSPAMASVDESILAPQAQCEKTPYAFCCMVGVKCDCTKAKDAPGQCAGRKGPLSSYAFCCDYGTPCDCTQPPLDGNATAAIVV